MQHVDAALHLLKHAAVRTKADFPKPSLKLTLYLDDLVGGRHHVSSERGEARTLHSHGAAVQTDKDPLLWTVAECGRHCCKQCEGTDGAPSRLAETSAGSF